MKKSIVSTTIAPANDLLGEQKAIELVAKAGFDAWDFAMFKNIVKYEWETGKEYYADHPLAGKDYIKFARELKKVAQDNGIFCNQSHAPFPTKNKLVQDNLKRCIELTAEVGGKICVVHPDNDKSPVENAEMYQRILPFAKEHGVKIATENMWNWDYEKNIALPAACSHHDDFLAHINAINDEYFVACLDIGHAEMAGLDTSAVQMIRTLGKNIQCLHIHDNDLHYDNHQIPFSMKIDFYKIIKELKAIGYAGDFTLECDAYLREQEDKESALKNMYIAVRKLADEFDAIK